MKKIILLAITVVAITGIASAQEQAMKVNKADGSTFEFEINDITNITFGDAEWVYLGQASFYDSFFFDNAYKADIWMNQTSKKEFKMLYPYREGLYEEEYLSKYEIELGTYFGNVFLTFEILSPGDDIWGNKVTQENLVYFHQYCSGWQNYYYDGAVVQLYHPGDFTNYGNESYWTYNKVVSYQEDGETPAVVWLAPFYYMDYIGGWDCSSDAGIIEITFPSIDDSSNGAKFLNHEHGLKSLISSEASPIKAEKVVKK